MSKTNNISSSIKRKLRQEAGFGCCKCGNPIIEYHHILQGSENPDDIMTLCPICHHEATLNAMKEKEQRSHKLNPYNLKKGYVQGKLKVNENTPVLNIGSNQFIGEGDFLSVDDESLLSLQINSKILEISLKVYDENDNLIANIENNEWISGDPMPWDIESSFQWLKLRHKLRNIFLEIDARKFPIELKANLWRKKQNFQLNSQEILFNGVVQNVGFSNHCFVALNLSVNTSSGKLEHKPFPQIGKGCYVSWPDLQERIQRGLVAWEKLKNHEI